MPDMFGDGTPRRVSDPDHVVLLIHGLCELAGTGSSPTGSRVTVDGDGAATGTFKLDVEDLAAWDAMDEVVDEFLQQLRGDYLLEYWSPSTEEWVAEPTARRMPFAFHETGTLWMGPSSDQSVTNTFGRLHGTDNLYVLGGATFPARGSWNPFLTMAALALRLADRLTKL
jgi:choline dehydrogenase-like flavoprotein